MSFFKKTLLRLFPPLLLLLAFPSGLSAQSNTPPAMIGNLNTVFSYVVIALIGLVGLTSLAMLLMGGFYYISAGADKDAAQRAQQTINYSVGGLIVSISAWLLLSLIGAFFGVDLSVFNICITPNCN